MAQENPQTQTEVAAGTTTFEPTEFEALLNKEFRPKTDQAKSAVQEAVKTLAQQALGAASLISDDVLLTIQSLVGELDRKLAEQVNMIIHHEEFRKLEGTWRGLYHLVSNTETDEMLKIRVLNVSKQELGKTPAKHIEDLRLESARRHLEESSLTTDEVADACGLASAEVLRRMFRRRLHVTPGQYRAAFGQIPLH